MNETEIERLVVRIVGDASNYLRTINEVNAAARAQQQEEQRVQEVMRTGEAVTRSVETAQESYIRQMEELTNLYQQNAITLAIYNRKADELSATLHRVRDAQNGTAQAQAQAVGVIRSVETAQESYMRQMEELTTLYNHNAIKLDVYDRKVKQLTNTLKRAEAEESGLAEAQVRARQVMMSLESTTEKYDRRLQELNQYLRLGALTQKEYDKAVVTLQADLKRATEAESGLTAAMSRGKAITEQLETATEAYARTVNELNSLLQSGAISQDTYTRALGRANDQLAMSKDQSAALQGAITNVGISLITVGATLSSTGRQILATFGDMTTSAVYAAGKFEQTNVAFGVLLGSEQEAADLLKDLTQFAAETPFNMPEIEAAARGLVVFGERGRSLMRTLKNLGNAASATNTNFAELALIYNQIRGVGHLLTQDFRQLSSRGILSLQDLADYFKVPMEEAQRMLSAGEISFADVEKIFEHLSSETGRFANMMDKQSQTLLGKLAKFTDSVEILMRQVGERIAPIVGTILDYLQQLVDYLVESPPWVKDAIAVFIGLALALGALLVVVGSVVAVLGSLVMLIGGIAAAAPAIAAVVAALAPVTAAIGGAVSAIGAFITALSAAAVAMAALVAVAIGLAVAVGTTWGYVFYQNSEAIQEFADAMERSEVIAKRAAITYANTTQRIKASFNDLAGQAKLDKINEAIKSAEKDVMKFENQLKHTKKEMEEYNTTWNNLTGNKILEALRQEIAQTEEALKLAKDRAKEFQEEAKKVKLPDPFDKKAYDELNDALVQQIDNFGLSKKEIALRDLALQGATQAQLDMTAHLFDSLEVMEQEAEAARKLTQEEERKKQAIDNTLQSMEKSLETYGMSASQVRLYELKLAGATEQQLKYAEILGHALDEQKRLDDQKKKGAELTKKYQDPAEKMAQQVEELAQLFNEGHIDLNTYNAALKDLEKETKKDHKVKLSISGVEAVAAGSAEALARIEEYVNANQMTAVASPVFPNAPVGMPGDVGGAAGGIVGVSPNIEGVSVTADNSANFDEGSDSIVSAINSLREVLTPPTNVIQLNTMELNA